MAVYKDKNRGTWYASILYVDWTGKRCRKLKRGFATKKEAQEWEMHFKLQKASSLDMTFGDFYKIYEQDVKPKVRYNTWCSKQHIIETKLLPYFKDLVMRDITPRDIIQWQNSMREASKKNGGEYAGTYLKTVQAQLSSIFNHAVRFYQLPNNPVRIAGALGQYDSDEMLFWTKEEYMKFIPTMANKTYGAENTVTSWTKVAPTISVSATDYLSGTTYVGSGMKNIVIKDDYGRQVSSGVASTGYTLSDSYQGIHTWTIVATDNVDHISSKTVATKFDKTGPHCSSLIARPNSWSAGNGTVTFTVQDPWSGLSTVILQRYSYVTRTWENVQSWNYYGTTSAVSGSYTETAEGVFYYRLWMSDVLGNTSTTDSDTIYLDHSNPLIHGVENTVTDWTNVAPVISVSGTDYLVGTTYTGSGLRSIVIKDDSGNVVASGVTSTSYTLAARYEGIHTWYITATDNVGHTSSRSITTKYDCTKPGIDGTEITYVRPDGVTVSGYCQDNIINQHMDDEIRRSPNGANASSGLKSVILYRVTSGNKEVIYGDRTKAIWNLSDTHSWFDMYYEITADEKMVDYYEIIVTDFAGNRTKKKLTSQYSLLTWFHTSIDRSSYE